MAATATQYPPQTTGASVRDRRATVQFPPSSIHIPMPLNRLRNLTWAMPSPVNQNGSYEFDRIIKSGYVQKRTQKTKAWKPVYLVMRPNALYMYKSDKENKLRHKVFLSDLSAVVPLKDPKQKRQHLFGLYTPARNYHFEAPNAKEAKEWTDLIRATARIEEEEEEMFLASPVVRRESFAPSSMLLKTTDGTRDPHPVVHERVMTSSPEPHDRPASKSTQSGRPMSHNEYSGISGNEMVSQSDMSDVEVQRGHGASSESVSMPSTAATRPRADPSSNRPVMRNQNTSQGSGLHIERDPDRVVWQGWLWFLKSKHGMKQWKNCWAVLRPRNLILYKNESEYTASFILALSSIVDVVDLDPISKTKKHCMQIIGDEKSYRFCAPNEEALVHCLGAFKSLLSKRKGLEVRGSVSGPRAVESNL